MKSALHLGRSHEFRFRKAGILIDFELILVSLDDRPVGSEKAPQNLIRRWVGAKIVSRRMKRCAYMYYLWLDSCGMVELL